MKTIQIKEITLSNFKGVVKQKIEFDKNTDIFGANGTGKTTIMDAFLWVLFGKDSTDRKDFEIKTLDQASGLAIPKIEHEVSAVLEVNGEEIIASRILKENWVKKRGSETAEFSGNVTEFYWDGVPMQQKAYQEKVAGILEESVFKLITNPLAFNAMNWKDRRKVLVDIAGSMSDEELAKGNSEYEKLIGQLTNGKTLEEFRKQIVASIKKAKEDLKGIPTRIDEVSKGMPEKLDFKGLSSLIESKDGKLLEVNKKIQDRSAAFDELLIDINKKKSKANNLKSEIEIIESNARRESKVKEKPDSSKMDGLKRKLESFESDLEIANRGLKSISAKYTDTSLIVDNLESKIIAKRTGWSVENEKEQTISENNFNCPTCKREFEAVDIETKKAEIVKTFKDNKAEKLAEIQKEGGKLAEEKANASKDLLVLKGRIEKADVYVSELSESIKKLKADVKAEEENATTPKVVDEEALYEKILKSNESYPAKKTELKRSLSEIGEEPKVDISALQSSAKQLSEEIEEIKSKLRNEDQINLANKRIGELEEEEKALAQQIANVEKTEFIIEKFNKLKIDNLEGEINKKFQFVNFRMFEKQVNGGESECCDALIDGVPFSDANNAAKINAGLDIINTLCEFYEVIAPIFIDNRESVTEVIDLSSQLINLIVSDVDKKLRIA
jgi:exonuclease SbcC